MVGWAGAPQGAPVANKAGKTNSVQSTTHKIGLLGGGVINFCWRRPLWLPPLPKFTRYSPFPLMPLQTLPYWQIIAKTSPKP
ncbi:TPA: ash family protein [Salmonella enterica]|nr:ash family protein [Salmonella enterica]HED5889134.1 ash family protein [Salmonella enterica]